MSDVVTFTPEREDTLGAWTVVAALPNPMHSVSRPALLRTIARLGRAITYVADPQGGSPQTHTIKAIPPMPTGISEWERENYGAEAVSWLAAQDADFSGETVAVKLLLRK